MGLEVVSVDGEHRWVVGGCSLFSCLIMLPAIP